jgi:diguanylate cyclase (GGDEF)-like protein/PAS domain S-box-containing protein
MTGATGTVLDVMPLGVAVVDLDGFVRSANQRLAEMVGLPTDRLVGRSMLDFVVAEDLAFAGDVLAAGLLFVDQVMGPVRIRYRDAAGRVRFTEFWAKNCVTVPEIEGYVLTLAEESVADKLSDAIRSIAAGDDVDATLARIASAMSAHPVLSAGTVVVMHGDEVVPVGWWPDVPPVGADLERSEAGAAPWQDLLRRGESRDFVDLHGLPAAWQRTIAGAGFASVWFRPIHLEDTGDGVVAAALVVWRSQVGWPSPNQEQRMADSVAIGSLAFDQASYRASMRQAVYLDTLTGVGSRARLDEILRDDTGLASAVSVLYVDLDGFKAVNDRHGHDVGDAVLAEVGGRLTAALRDGDEVIRMGGDEFVVLCLSAPDDDAPGVAQRIVAELSRPYHVAASAGRPPLVLTITASVGVGAPGPGLSVAERIRSADRAMYDAKFDGKACWRPAVGDGGTDARSPRVERP